MIAAANNEAEAILAGSKSVFHRMHAAKLLTHFGLIELSVFDVDFEAPVELVMLNGSSFLSQAKVLGCRAGRAAHRRFHVSVIQRFMTTGARLRADIVI